MIYVFILICMLTSCTNAEKEETSPTPVPSVSETSTPMPSTPVITASPAIEPSPEAASHEDKAISGFETKILDKSKNRMINLKIAAKAIDGFVLKSNEEFSFNGVVGERSADKGYKEAGILVGEEHTTGMGGGVCQISTTLYNAAKIGGFEITERQSHKTEVAYAPSGEDATVNYDNIDFKFKNNLGFDVILKISVDENKVTVKIERV